MESLRGLISTPENAYDELVTGQKSIRYHWQGILSIIRSLPGGGLRERLESARRQLEESGATVNLLDDRKAPRWRFDPLPFVIAPDEWHDLEAGLIQRARLLDKILADLYGRQTLLAERLVPPALVHANRQFLRPCRVTDGKAPQRYLGQYAVDLVRLGDGRWHVLADHTEVPSGLGYALEIRRVLARSLPEAFRSIPVRHLRPFVDRWHEHEDEMLASADAVQEFGTAKQSGDFTRAHIYAGQSVGALHDIESAHAIIARLESDAIARLSACRAIVGNASG